MKLPIVVAVAVFAGTSVHLASPASGQTPPTADPPRQGCQDQDQWGECAVELPVPVETSNPSGDPENDHPTTARGPAPRPACPWVNVPAGPASEENLRRLFPEAPPDAVLQVRDCGDADLANIGGTQFSLGARWVPGGAPPPAPPPPSAVALMLWARVQERMEAPRLATNPPAGAAAVVDLPVFVEVTNWQGELSDGECVLLVCVEMTASPSLEWSPGEPQAPVVQCTPPGSRFDAAAGTAVAQASAPGTCAHAYQLRTGVDGRPEEWPGEVTVRWEVAWTSNVGVSGSFPELTFSTTAPRVVDEVQTVVAQ